MDWTDSDRSQVDAAIELKEPQFIVDPLAPDHVVAARNAYKRAVDAGGGEVVFKPYAYSFDNSSTQAGLLLERDNAGTRNRITIKAAGAKITLSANTPRFADFRKVADHDVFRSHQLREIAVDAANVAGKHHALIGTWQNGATQSRINIDGITVQDCTITNLLRDPNTGTNHRLGIWLSVARTAAGTGTDGPTNYIRNVTCRNVRIEGGNAGIACVGTFGAGTVGLEVFIDNILLEDCYHDCGVSPTAFFTSSNFHIGSRGYGGKATLRRCTGLNSGDVGIETNALDDVLVDNCTMQDTFNIAYYHTNYNTPPNPTTQRVTYRDTTAKVTSAGSSCTGYGWRSGENLSTPIGTVNIQRGVYSYDHGGNPLPATNGTVVGAPTVEFKTYNIDGLTAEHKNISNTVAGQILTFINLVPFTNTGQVNMRNVDLYASGTNSGGGAITLSGFVGGGPMAMNVDGFIVDFNITGATNASTRGMDIGNLAGSVTRGSISRFKIRRFGASDTTPRGILVRGTGLNTINAPFVISQCDFVGNLAGGTDILYSTDGGASNAANVTELNNAT